MTDIIKDHDLEFSQHEAAVAERFLARARKSSAILGLQGPAVGDGSGWVPASGKVDGVISTDPDRDSSINTPNASRGVGEEGDLNTVLQQLDSLYRKMQDLLNSYVSNAKVNKTGSTKSTSFPEKNAGTHNPFAAKSDQLLLDGEHQLRLQSKLAQLVAEHRRASSR